MPYILIERKLQDDIVLSEIEIVTTVSIYDRIIDETNFLRDLKNYILKISDKRGKLGANSREARKEKLPRCCDNVEGCRRAFYTLIMHRELVENENFN